MNSLDELRTSLRTHAHDLDHGSPLDVGTRTTQLRGRVRAVRRRRAAGVAVAAAAVVGVVSLVPVLLPGDRAPSPASVPTELAGHPVPATIEAAGWTYEYAGSVTGTDQVKLDLEGLGRPIVIAWANEVIPQPYNLEAWKVAEPDGDAYRPTAADFSQYWRADAGEEGTFEFSGPGENALAFYELSDELPAGVTVEGMTFREQVAGDRLVAADAVRGESTLRLSVEVPDGDLRFGAVCAGTEGPAQYELLLDGSRVVWGDACADEVSFDPGVLTLATLTDEVETDAGPLAPGDVVAAELRLVDADGRPVEVGTDTLLAAGFYEVAEPATLLEPAGVPVPRLVEVDGVTWTLANDLGRLRTRTGTALDLVEHRVRVDEPSMGYAFASGIREKSNVVVTVDGEVRGTMQGGGGMGPFFLPPGSRIDVRVEGTGAGGRPGAAIYTRTP
ncbi:hypothetical protein [Nocardioides sp. 616]|uniref:hypothetical protein n=1 Tax=Nocardioides sp. 616 TaxID=2268090 RepID=UPI000CE45962|nr:hypothetical protein [Nocardioides sp. 616]